MNTNQTREQRIASELADAKARIAKNNAIADAELAEIKASITSNNAIIASAIPVAIAKPKTARKPRVKIAKSDQKFKNAIQNYQKNTTMREVCWWIEDNATIEMFYERFHDYPIPEKLAILEIAFGDDIGTINRFLEWDPECESE